MHEISQNCCDRLHWTACIHKYKEILASCCHDPIWLTSLSEKCVQLIQSSSPPPLSRCVSKYGAVTNILQLQFSARLRRSYVNIQPLDDVNGFTWQLEQAVTDTLNILAPLKACTKRRDKSDCHWLSDEAVTAKQTRRQLERRRKRSGSDADRFEYRSACRAANAAISAPKSSFYKERLSMAAGNQRALWRISKDLLHNDDRPPDACSLEAKLLCDGFSMFFADKLKLIAATICTRLPGVAAYYSQRTCRKSPTMLDFLLEVSAEEVSRLIGALPAKTLTPDFLLITLMKSCAVVMAPVIAWLVNRSFSTGVFPSTLKCGRETPLLKKPCLDKTVMANYQPITNLSFRLKLLERRSVVQGHMCNRRGISASFNQSMERAIQRKLRCSSFQRCRAKHQQSACHRFACTWYFHGVRHRRFWRSSRLSEGGLLVSMASLLNDCSRSCLAEFSTSMLIRLVLRPSRACLVFQKAASLGTIVRVVHFSSWQCRFCTMPPSTSRPTTLSFTWRSVLPTSRH